MLFIIMELLDLERGEDRKKGLSLQVSNISMKSPNQIKQEKRLKARSAELMLNETEVHLQNDITCGRFKWDRRCVIFAFQGAVSMSVLLLCAIKLLTNPSSEDKTIYCSMLSSVVGYWMSPPTLGSKK